MPNGVRTCTGHRIAKDESDCNMYVAHIARERTYTTYIWCLYKTFVRWDIRSTRPTVCDAVTLLKHADSTCINEATKQRTDREMILSNHAKFLKVLSRGVIAASLIIVARRATCVRD